MRISDWSSDVCSSDLGGDHALVPNLDGDHARLGHAERADLGDRHLGAVGLDGDRLQQADRGAARAEALELAPEGLERVVHALLYVVYVRIGNDITRSHC